MRIRHKRWAVAVLLLAILLLLAIVSLSSRPPATAEAVAMTFLGYTNFPGNHLRFALFSESNQAPYAVRWRGSWVEVEGDPSHKAPTINPSFFSRAPVLNARAALRLAIGEPFQSSETGRWRFAMSFTRYAWQARWLDLSFRYKLPLRLGPVVLADEQRILDPTNYVTAATVWLAR